MGSCCCRKRTVFILFVLGISLLIAGIIVAALGSFKSLAEDEIKKNLPLKSGSTSFENWEKPEGDLFIEYYVLDITNTNVANGGIPEIVQRGPYTYREESFSNVTKRQGQTITYIPNTKYYFDRARSCKNCNPIIDKIVTINYPLLIFLKPIQVQVKNTSTVVQVLKSLNISFFQKRSVHELLWGYKDPNLKRFLTAILRSPQEDRVFSLQTNNSGSGLTKIHTGEHDVDRVGEYLEWISYRKLPWWNSDAANTINGTGGGRFKPALDKDDELYAMVTEICRSMKFTYLSTVEVHGIELYRFTIQKEVFESGDVNSNNKGFCVNGADKKCLPTGLLDINACKGGRAAPPFVASTPNFYLGESFLSETFKLKPDAKKDQTYFDVEPNTGLTMQGHKRLQLNLRMPTFSILNFLRNVNTSKPTYFPLFFTDESAVISEDDADDFKEKVLLPLRAISALPYVIIALGGLLLLIALIIAVFLYIKKEKHGTNLNGGKDVVLSNYPAAQT